MGNITFNTERCKGCGLCVNVCPKKILDIRRDKRNEKGYFTACCIDSSLCVKCLSCAEMCPDCAIEIG